MISLPGPGYHQSLSEPPRVCRELRCLRGAQGLAAAAPRGFRHRPLHREAADAEQGVIRGHAGAHDGKRKGSGLPARPRQPTVPGTAAERAVGFGFHLRGHLVGFRLRSPRDRHLRPPDRRLADVTLRPCGVRAGCPGAGLA